MNTITIIKDICGRDFNISSVHMTTDINMDYNISVIRYRAILSYKNINKLILGRGLSDEEAFDNFLLDIKNEMINFMIEKVK